MKYYSKLQIAKAKDVDTLEYLQDNYPMMHFKRAGREYQHKSDMYGKIVVYPDRKGWIDYTHDLHGISVLDWVIKVEGLKFDKAVGKLIGEDGEINFSYKAAPTVSHDIKPKEIVLPERTQGRYDRVVAYLTKTRCIDPQIVNWCFKKNILYEDSKHNCVFCGLDEKGSVKYASKRGTYTHLKEGQKPYKGECAGSDKSYGFVMEGESREHLYVFEAPIDAMSHATLCNIKAMNNGALEPQKAFMNCTRIALGGTADNALQRYLSTHPDVQEISFCLDNDAAGRSAAEKHTEKYANMCNEKGLPLYKVSSYFIPERFGKDYNEFLQAYVNAGGAKVSNQRHR